MAYQISVERGGVPELALPLWATMQRSAEALRAETEWYYAQLPEGQALCVMLEHESPDQETKTVGASGLGPRVWQVRRQREQAHLMGDFVVDKAHRSLLPAMMIQRKVRELALEQGTWAYGFPNAKALPVFERLGYQVAGHMVRWVHVIDPTPYLARRFGSREWTRALGWLGAQAQRNRSQLERWQARHLRFRVVPDLRDGLDDVPSYAARQFSLVASRTPAFLHWRFFQAPGHDVQLLRLESKHTGRLVGYAVIEQADETLHVRDCLANSRAGWESLLFAVKDAARRMRLQAVSVSTLEGSQFAQALTAAGFAPRPPRRPLVICGRAHASLPDPRQWLFTEADEDH